MEARVHISANGGTPKPLDLTDLPAPKTHTRFAGRTVAMWNLAPADWAGLPRLRKRLTESGLQWSESYTLASTTDELKSAAWVEVHPPKVKGLEAPEVGSQTCPECQLPRPQVEDEPISLHGAIPDLALFTPLGTSLVVIHESLKKRLTDEGLTRGIRWTPVKLNDGTVPEFFVPKPETNLGWGEAQHGWVSEPCTTCGSHRARWAFADHFLPEAAIDWAYSARGGPWRPLCTGDVFSLLLDATDGQLSGEWRGGPDFSPYLPEEFR